MKFFANSLIILVDTIDKPDAIDESVFTDMEKGLIDSVVKHLCCYSGKILEAFTHQETPWLIARKGLPVGAPSTQIIPKDDIGSYFAAVKEKHNMSSPADIYLYSVEMFKRVNG